LPLTQRFVILLHALTTNRRSMKCRDLRTGGMA
jgi:hypothetical protein